MKRTFLLLTLFVAIMFQQVAAQKEDPKVDIEVGEIGPVSIELKFIPNATCAKYYTLLAGEGEMDKWTQMTGKPIDQLITEWGQIPHEGVWEHTFTYSFVVPDSIFEIYARPYDADGKTYPYTKVVLPKTPSIGGDGLSTMELSVEPGDSTVVTRAFPNDQTFSFRVSVATESVIENMGLDNFIETIVKKSTVLFIKDEWLWPSTLSPNTKYKAVALGMNKKREWGEPMVVDFTTLPTLGDDGIAKVELTTSDITENSVKLNCKANESTEHYHAGVIELSEFNKLGKQKSVEKIISEEYGKFNLLYQESIKTVENLKAGTDYKAIAVAMNGPHTWCEPTIIGFKTLCGLEPVAVNDLEGNTAWAIYPTISNGVFTIDNKLNSKSMMVYDLNGKLVKEINISTSTQVDISSLPANMYFVKLDNCNEVKKIVIKK